MSKKVNAIELRPTYWASVSGGKDSFYMLYLILQNLDKYPLDGVVYFDLDIDYPFIKDVIDYIEVECKKHGITMFRIKPEHTWEELFYEEWKRGKNAGKKWMYPTRTVRWCNKHFKLNCRKQLDEMMKAQGKRTVVYIGFCADEEKRFVFDLHSRDNKVDQIYPLAEMGIVEKDILEWARKQSIYNGYYLENNRCGCMGCPMASMNDFVYLKTHYPDKYKYFMDKALETERERERELGRPFSVWEGNAKYNTEYRMKRVDEIIAKRNSQINLFESEEVKE